MRLNNFHSYHGDHILLMVTETQAFVWEALIVETDF